eukprot:12914437-Prorocentrum_lima.AAC.1
MEAINLGSLMKMDNEEKEQWIDTIRAELKSFEDLEVFDEVTQEEANAMKKEGSQPKKLPARLILVKKKSPVPKITMVGSLRQELYVV